MYARERVGVIVCEGVSRSVCMSAVCMYVAPIPQSTIPINTIHRFNSVSSVNLSQLVHAPDFIVHTCAMLYYYRTLVQMHTAWQFCPIAVYLCTVDNWLCQVSVEAHGLFTASYDSGAV